MVARNLGWRGVAVTDETVVAEVERIISARAELHAVDVLASPQVILAAHGEEWSESKGVVQAGDQRFLPPALLAEMTDRVAESGGEITTVRPANPASLESVREAKQVLLDALTHELESATVVLDGHGGPDAFYFADGQIAEAENALEITETDRTVKVTVAEFADVLEERFKAQQAAGHHVAETNLSIVFAACYMSDFVRALAVELQARQVPLPRLMITAAEYGQYGFTTLQDPRASTTLIQILETESVGNFIEADQIYSLPEQYSNPSVFVPSPDDPHTLMQISGRQDYEVISTRMVT
jgi:hypothetical protein